MESEKDIHYHCTYPKVLKISGLTIKQHQGLIRSWEWEEKKPYYPVCRHKILHTSKDLELTNSIMVQALQLPCKVLSLSYTPKGNDCQWEYGCGGYYWEGN